MVLTAAMTATAVPSTPVTKEWLGDFVPTLSQVYNATGLATAGSSISNATTNTALVTVPASLTALAVAGSTYYIKAWGIASSPGSAPATLAWNTYSGGSGGTALTAGTEGAFVAITPTVSLASALFDVEVYVTFMTATTVSCIQAVRIGSSTSTSAVNSYLAGNNSATGVTVTAGNTITVNAVMGSAVSGSSFQAVGGFYNQVA